MKEIEKLQKEIEAKELECINLELKIKASVQLLEAMKAAQTTRKDMLEAYKVLHQVNNN